jgi:hypothetical protein
MDKSVILLRAFIYACLREMITTIRFMIIPPARTGSQKEAEALPNSSESQYAKLSLQMVGILMKFRTKYGD